MKQYHIRIFLLSVCLSVDSDQLTAGMGIGTLNNKSDYPVMIFSNTSQTKTIKINPNKKISAATGLAFIPTIEQFPSPPEQTKKSMSKVLILAPSSTAIFIRDTTNLRDSVLYLLRENNWQLYYLPCTFRLTDELVDDPRTDTTYYTTMYNYEKSEVPGVLVPKIVPTWPGYCFINITVNNDRTVSFERGNCPVK